MSTKKNPVAKALRSDLFKQRKVKPKKGKASYRRLKGGKAGDALQHGNPKSRTAD